MDVVVHGRGCDVSSRFREHAVDKVGKVEKYDHKCVRVDVEVCRERNPRLADLSHRVELTCRSRGPVIRAEAAAADPFAALDVAYDKLETRLRRAADRRRVHHGQRRPVSVAAATAPLASLDGSAPAGSAAGGSAQASVGEVAGEHLLAADGPFVVREKVHRAVPMTLDQALHEMELVGHDFFLFVDAEGQTPSVVYRRRGYDYGVIRLALEFGDGLSPSSNGAALSQVAPSTP